MPDSPQEPPAGTPAVDAIPLLYDLHAGMIRGLSWRISGSEDLADEILQDTFLEAQKSWSNFEGRSKASTWLCGIAIRQWKRRQRRRAGEPARIPSLEALLPFGERTSSVIPGRGESPLDAAIRREAVTAVHRAILELPDDFRVPLVLKDMIELSVKDVAVALGLNEQTVKTRLHRARFKIREAMRRVLPQAAAVDPAFDRQTCIDLINAKLTALDAGRAFPVDDDFVCERCNSVFDELDLACDLCRDFTGMDPPASIRELLVRRASE
ncbi:MAG: sigma-70 family RNA polymerase sigma factor [Phycisphaerales bacterium]|jgi:RNA polymerase sigma factor (sigma-70 family)|nr:sigma-70 family RNA polymerase sigma factor [Phycisphaerales bacterium]